jgi:hypothetical protein
MYTGKICLPSIHFCAHPLAAFEESLPFKIYTAQFYIHDMTKLD